MASLIGFANASPHPSKPWIDIEYPQDKDKFWWDSAWWKQGQLDVPQNHAVSMQMVSYLDDDMEVEAYLFKPKKPGKYLPVLFQHGRRGLDTWTLPRIKRLAARGFVVLAPDMFGTHMKEPFPMEHDYQYDSHTAKGIDALLDREDVIGDKACIVSHTRGGYMALKALVTHQQQNQKVGCYVGYYPHWQDPNLPEPMQIYQYAPEVDELEVPVLVFVGEHDQYQRLRPILMGIESLQEQGKEAKLIIYPGVGRGFDFRPEHVRTFADDLASKDANQRTAKFITKHLQ